MSVIAEIPVPELAGSSEAVLASAVEIVAEAAAQMLVLPPAAALVDSTTERTQLGWMVAQYSSPMEQELTQETALASKVLVAAELASGNVVRTIEFVIDWLVMAGTETEE